MLTVCSMVNAAGRAETHHDQLSHGMCLEQRAMRGAANVTVSRMSTTSSPR